MNVEDLILGVQRLFGDTAEAQINRNDILRWLNHGQLEIAKSTEVLQRHSEVDLVAGDDCYPLPSDCMFLRRVEVNGKKIERVDFEEIDTVLPNRNAESGVTGEPNVHWVWDDKIWFWPTPSTGGSGNLDIWYIRRPSTLAANEDIPEIPAYMHEDLIQYAVMKAKELDEDWEASSLLRQDIMQRMGENRHNKQNPERDSYPAVRALPDDLGW